MLKSAETPDRDAKPRTPARAAPASLLFFLIFLWGAALRFHGLTGPFLFDNQGENASYMSLAARNWLRHGFWDLKFLQVIDGGPLVAGSEVYSHHPPLVPMLVAFGFKLSGSFSEGCARTVPITFSLGTLVLLYLIVRRVWSERIALLAGFCYALMPYATYFANDVCYETGNQFFFLLIVYWYRRYMESERARYFILMCLSLAVGALNDWPAFFTVPILGLHWWWRFPGRRRPYFLLFPALAVVLAGVFLWAIAQAEGTWKIAQITALFKPDPDRPSPSGAPPYTLRQWVRAVIINDLVYYCTPAVVTLALLWAGGFLLRALRRRITDSDILLVVLLSHGALYIALGHSWAFNHNYWASVIMPGLSVAAAVAFYHGAHHLMTRHRRAGWVWSGLFGAALLWFGIFCTQRFYRLHAAPVPDVRPVARIVKENTGFEDPVLTTLDSSLAIQLRFYSDRNISLGISSPEQFLEIYKTPYRGISWAGGPPLGTALPYSAYDRPGPAYRYFFLADEQREADAALYDFLKAAYRMRAVAGFTIFDLKDTYGSGQRSADGRPWAGVAR